MNSMANHTLTFEEIKELAPHVNSDYIKRLLDDGWTVEYQDTPNVSGGDGGVGFTDPATKTIQISNDPGISGNLAHELVHGTQVAQPNRNLAQFSANIVPKANANPTTTNNLLRLGSGLVGSALDPNIEFGDFNTANSFASEFTAYGADPRREKNQAFLGQVYPDFFTGPEVPFGDNQPSGGGVDIFPSFSDFDSQLADLKARSLENSRKSENSGGGSTPSTSAPSIPRRRNSDDNERSTRNERRAPTTSPVPYRASRGVRPE